MSEIRGRAKEWLKAPVSMVRAEDIVVDLLAELERVEKIAEPIESGKVVAELTRLNQRISELEAENNRLNTLLHKASQKSAEDFTEYIKEARMQAARECVEIIIKETKPHPLFQGSFCNLVISAIKAHFAIKGE